MRQRIGVALVLALLALTIGVKDSAPLLAGGGRPPVTLSLPSATTVNPGDTFDLDISLNMEADSHAISIVTLVLAFDPTVLKVTDFSPADVLPAVLESSIGTDTAGLTASIGMNPAAAIKRSTTVATITLQVVGSGGAATPIRFTRAEAYSLSAWDEASENVVGSTIDASITITAPTTMARVSVSSAGQQADDSSSSPSISTDGRFVAFNSHATNLVSDDTNGVTDVFVHDRQTGETSRVSISSTGQQADGLSGANNYPSISADGRFVAFSSDATNLVSDDTNGVTDIFVHDRQTGETRRVSVSSTGQQANYPSIDDFSISADGRFVAFTSIATNLVPDDANNGGVFVHDRQTGETSKVSVNGSSVSISADGRFVAFTSIATNLVPDDTNNTYDVFVHDRQTGETSRVSISSTGQQADDSSYSDPRSISADGRFVAFNSYATNLVPDDTNNGNDVFVHDRQTGETSRVSVSSTSQQAADPSIDKFSISADGRFVAFSSNAIGLVVGDTDKWQDVFVHDRQTGETSRVSISSTGQQADENSYSVSISADGRFVAFTSIATNLVPDDTNGVVDVFVHNRSQPEGSDTQPPPGEGSTPPPATPTPTPPSAPLSIFAEATGSPTPDQLLENASLEDTITNGDFVIRRAPEGLNVTLGDGIDEVTTWTFDFTGDPNFDNFPSAPLAFARLDVTLTPTSSLVIFDVIRIEGLPDITSPPQFEDLPVDTPTTVQIDLLEYYTSDDIMGVLSRTGQIPMFYGEDAIISLARLNLTANIQRQDAG